MLAYFLVKIFSKKGIQTNDTLVFDSIIFTLILLLVLSSTGGLNSSFFFLVYFLIFVFATLFDPPITVTLTLFVTLFFTNTVVSLHQIIQLASLLFITPLAIFFGKQYLNLLESRKKIKVLSKKEKVLEKEITSQETDSLLFLSLDFKDGLVNIVNDTADLLSNIGRLSLRQKENLQKILKTAKNLLLLGEKLRQKVEDEANN